MVRWMILNNDNRKGKKNHTLISAWIPNIDENKYADPPKKVKQISVPVPRIFFI